MRRSKSYLEKKQKLQPLVGSVPLNEAIRKLKLVARDWESVDIAIRLGVDPRKADQNVRGNISFPHGTGRTPRVAVFAKGEKVVEARDAGADKVGLEDIIEQIKEGVIDFDIAIATPDVMKEVSKVAKILGPRGLMPNPKSGTTTFEVAAAVKEFRAGKVNFRVEKAGIVHVTAGKGSFAESQLVENIEFLLAEINRLRPPSVKGQYVKSVAVSATQSPAIRIDPLTV
ncbi:MAG: 50S ribosomal protein L1 [Candidatus Riflebacteria bacterium RBG_13_59_9]|nr:MAG: 50S ribosomal protein L1 [Candidatus Riflebacteria bacterium RBG_13_59_9]